MSFLLYFISIYLMVRNGDLGHKKIPPWRDLKNIYLIIYFFNDLM